MPFLHRLVNSRFLTPEKRREEEGGKSRNHVILLFNVQIVCRELNSITSIEFLCCL